MVSAGLDVTAIEVSEARIARLSENLERLSMKVEIIQHDWLNGPLSEAPEYYDAVLVDAPCTGLGTVRRHPEILWRRHPADPKAMAIRQLQILTHASAHVKPGGALIYAVCSPEPEEGLQVVQMLSGWTVERSWSSVPPVKDEDAFQAFILRREET
jgi:16S rRNA (cytosine967-C5)-methyltransferase